MNADVDHVAIQRLQDYDVRKLSCHHVGSSAKFKHRFACGLTCDSVWPHSFHVPDAVCYLVIDSELLVTAKAGKTSGHKARPFDACKRHFRILVHELYPNPDTQQHELLMVNQCYINIKSSFSPRV